AVTRETPSGNPGATHQLSQAEHAVEQAEEGGQLCLVRERALHVFVKEIVDEIFSKKGKHRHPEEQREITVLEKTQPGLAILPLFLVRQGLSDGPPAQRVHQ